jgi:hypothetical protein
MGSAICKTRAQWIERGAVLYTTGFVPTVFQLAQEAVAMDSAKIFAGGTTDVCSRTKNQRTKVTVNGTTPRDFAARSQ